MVFPNVSGSERFNSGYSRKKEKNISELCPPIVSLCFIRMTLVVELCCFSCDRVFGDGSYDSTMDPADPYKDDDSKVNQYEI